MNKVLIIDDDKELCALMKKCIEQEKLSAVTVYNGIEGVRLIDENKDSYSLIILDVMLPDIDGFQILQKIRDTSNIPVLMLTAKSSEEDKVFGLRLGADDYLTKPFGINELLARVNSLIRRYTTLNPFTADIDSISLKDMVIDKLNRTVTVKDIPVLLTGKEFDLLLFLASNKGRVFTKKQIYSQVWEEEYAFDDSNIMSFISKLRKKIEPDPDHPFYILTVRGVATVLTRRRNMDINVYLFIVIALMLLIIMYLLFVLRRVRTQLALIKDALEDIKGGNLNRRILAGENDMTKTICYDINKIAVNSQAQLIRQRQSEQAYKRLMTSLSHDVKTPLASLVGYLEAVENKIVIGEEKDEYIHVAHEKAHYMKSFVENLFEWVKLDSGEQIFHFEKFDLNELSRNIIADWIPVLESNHFEYEFVIPETEYFIHIDVNAYTRVLNNLFQNIIIHSAGDKMALHICEDIQQAKIIISDNGKGIAPDKLPHIFERMYQCDQSRSAKGNGLGLAIAKELISVHKGTITAENSSDKGTVFTILLPKAL